MKTINKPALAVFALLVASALVTGCAPGDGPTDHETGWTNDTASGANQS